MTPHLSLPIPPSKTHSGRLMLGDTNLEQQIKAINHLKYALKPKRCECHRDINANAASEMLTDK